MSRKRSSVYNLRNNAYRMNKRTRTRTSSNSSGHSALARYASQGSGAALGFIAGNVPGAVNGANLAGQAYDFTHEMDHDFNLVARALLPTKSRMSRSHFKGNFKRPRKIHNTFEKTALKIGSHCQFETYGKVADPNSVYIAHSTWDRTQMSLALRLAFIRKLFYKAGHHIHNRNETLPLLSQTVSTGFKIVVTHINPGSATVTVSNEYVILAAESLTDVVQNFATFTTQIDADLNNTSESVPARIVLYQHDYDDQGPTAYWRLASSINMKTEYIIMHCTSLLKIQNRTAGDTAATGNLDVDRTDMQPLKGRIYQFSSADPRLKNPHARGADTSSILQGCSDVGVRLLRGADFGNDAYQNLPDTNIYSNCTKSVDVIMQPADMRQTAVTHVYKGLFHNVFKKMNMEFLSTTIATGVHGKAQVLAFEEKIRTAGTNNITIQYEREYKCGVILKSGKGGSLTSTMGSTAVDLV